MEADADRIRLDKWLWAARFFKTRSLASQAIDLGRVRIDGERIKPARGARVGEMLDVQVGDRVLRLQTIGLEFLHKFDWRIDHRRTAQCVGKRQGGVDHASGTRCRANEARLLRRQDRHGIVATGEFQRQPQIVFRLPEHVVGQRVVL